MTSSREDIEFIETKQYQRFKEFCDACRKYQYIGLCYGVPGVGKTVSARHYANWDKVSSYEPLRSSRIEDLPGVLGSAVAFYTVTVVNSAGQVAKDVHALRRMLREFVVEDLHREKDERLDAIRRREQEEINVLLTRRETAGCLFQEVADAAYQARKELNEEYWDKVKAAKDPTDLVIVDETDHLRMGGLEQLRAIYDGGRIGMVLIGMPGLEKRLARYPQLYSRVGFVHEFKPLSQGEVRQLLRDGWGPLDSLLPRESLIDEEALAMLIRVTAGRFRELYRLLQQIGRVMEINRLDNATREVVAAARESLVIGTA